MVPKPARNESHTTPALISAGVALRMHQWAPDSEWCDTQIDAFTRFRYMHERRVADLPLRKRKVEA